MKAPNHTHVLPPFESPDANSSITRQDVQIIGDAVITDISFTLGPSLENLTLAEGAGDIDGTGNAENNIIQGNSGNNVLNGLAGSDFLFGDAGDDVLVGGPGQNQIDGGNGNDIAVYLGTRDDYLITESNGIVNVEDLSLDPPFGSFDTLENIEVLRFADGDRTVQEIMSGNGDVIDGIDIGDAGNYYDTADLATDSSAITGFVGLSSDLRDSVPVCCK